jgi:hypothetical protein
MDRDSQVLENALNWWHQVHSARTLVWDLLPIIRDPTSVEHILSRLPMKARALVIHELRTGYGPHVDLSGGWAMAAAAYVDIEQARRDHEARVAHALIVAVPAIRAWLAANPDE